MKNMKKLNSIMTLAAMFCVFQGYGVISPQQKNKWATDINNIITDDAINANGKIIDQNVITKLMDYNVAVLATTKPADKDEVQNALDTIRQQRLQGWAKKNLNARNDIALQMSTWTADINNILTNDAVNASGKIIDQDVITKLMDYNVAVLAATSSENKDYVQNALDTIRQQRLQEIISQKKMPESKGKSTKKKPEPKGKNIKKSKNETPSKGKRINLLSR